MGETAEASSLRERYERDGFLVCEQVVGPIQVERMRQLIHAQWATRRDRRARESEQRWDRVRPELPRLHRYSVDALEVILSPGVLEIVRELLGPDADMMWNQAHAKAPDEAGMTAIPWHQDGAYAEMEHPDTLSIWIAMQPTDETNGGLAFCPGSHAKVVEHRWDEELKYFGCEPLEPIVRPTIKAGDAFVFHARCIHGSPPNQSSKTRAGYSLSFGLPEARLLPSRTLFGDQLPVLRRGKTLHQIMLQWAEGDREIGEELLAKMRERLPRQAAAIERAASNFARACHRGEEAEIAGALFELMSISEDDVMVNGDLVRARTEVTAIERELEEVGASLEPRERELLLRRLAELDPDSEFARRGLEQLAVLGA